MGLSLFLDSMSRRDFRDAVQPIGSPVVSGRCGTGQTLLLCNAAVAFERSPVQNPLDETRKKSGPVTVRFLLLGHQQ
jgi:hypothetical protein